jgi:hypothetical protein
MDFPKKYIPETLTSKDRNIQRRELLKSQRSYKTGKYHTRRKLKSYKHRLSQHIRNAQRIYNVENIKPSKELAKATKCSFDALLKIEKKGQGAYYSSGSRPNQTAHSWGRARLASAVTGGKSSIIDYNILKEGCKKNSKALRLANKTRKLTKNKTQ